MRRIPIGCLKIGKDERQAIKEVIRLGRISEGQKTFEFEKKWARYIGTKYCVATSSGSGALICVLTAFKYHKNLKNGTEVITTPLTYIADSSAISAVGFKPVYVDVDPSDFCIHPEAIESYLKKRKMKAKPAIALPVDLMGFPVKIDEINRIAKKYQLLVLEDAAQAHGTIYKKSKAGSLANAGVFSFYIAHNIQVGEMGAITTNDYEIYRLCKKIKAQGRACDCFICTRGSGFCKRLSAYKGEGDFEPRFTHDLIGYNFKPMEWQSALALSQLKKIDSIIYRRQRNLCYLNNRLKKYQDILQLPFYSPKFSYLAYPLVIKKPDIITRKDLRRSLERYGIETRPLFGCIPTQQPAYSFLKRNYRNKLPNAEYLGENGFYIGCHQYLEKEDLDYVVSILDRIFKNLLYVD